MPVDVDGAAVLSPAEMREMRTLSGLDFTQFSRAVGIARSTLCEYEHGVTPLRPEQLERCEKALRKAMIEHGARIAKIVNGRRESAMAV